MADDSVPETAGAPKMRPGRRGGRLLAGGKKGNKGGLGRTPSAIRETLRISFAERIIVLQQVVDDPKSTTSDRVKALDLMARYGLGTTTTTTDTEGRDAPTAGRLTPEEIAAEVKRILGE